MRKSIWKNGWRLSPLYDVNPCAYGDTLALNVNEYSNEISLELAIEASDYYGLTKEHAERLASECIETVKQNWEKIATTPSMTAFSTRASPRLTISAPKPAVKVK